MTSVSPAPILDAEIEAEVSTQAIRPAKGLPLAENQAISEPPDVALKWNEPERRGSEMAWIMSNRDALSRLTGKWVALEGDVILATEASAAAAIRVARSKGIAKPFVFFVYPEPDLA